MHKSHPSLGMERWWIEYPGAPLRMDWIDSLIRKVINVSIPPHGRGNSEWFAEWDRGKTSRVRIPVPRFQQRILRIDCSSIGNEDRLRRTDPQWILNLDSDRSPSLAPLSISDPANTETLPLPSSIFLMLEQSDAANSRLPNESTLKADMLSLARVITFGSRSFRHATTHGRWKRR